MRRTVRAAAISLLGKCWHELRWYLLNESHGPSSAGANPAVSILVDAGGGRLESVPPAERRGSGHLGALCLAAAAAAGATHGRVDQQARLRGGCSPNTSYCHRYLSVVGS